MTKKKSIYGNRTLDAVLKDEHVDKFIISTLSDPSEDIVFYGVNKTVAQRLQNRGFIEDLVTGVRMGSHKSRLIFDESGAYIKYAVGDDEGEKYNAMYQDLDGEGVLPELVVFGTKKENKSHSNSQIMVLKYPKGYTRLDYLLETSDIETQEKLLNSLGQTIGKINKSGYHYAHFGLLKFAAIQIEKEWKIICTDPDLEKTQNPTDSSARIISQFDEFIDTEDPSFKTKEPAEMMKAKSDYLTRLKTAYLTGYNSIIKR